MNNTITHQPSMFTVASLHAANTLGDGHPLVRMLQRRAQGVDVVALANHGRHVCSLIDVIAGLVGDLDTLEKTPPKLTVSEWMSRRSALLTAITHLIEVTALLVDSGLETA